MYQWCHTNSVWKNITFFSLWTSEREATGTGTELWLKGNQTYTLELFICVKWCNVELFLCSKYASHQLMIRHGVRSVGNQMDKWGHMFTMSPFTLTVKMAEQREAAGLLISCCKSVIKSLKQVLKAASPSNSLWLETFWTHSLLLILDVNTLRYSY